MDGSPAVDRMGALRDDLIAALREVFGVHATDFTVGMATNEPVSSLNMEFTVYEYFPIGFEYERGQFGFSVLYQLPVGIRLAQRTSRDLQNEGQYVQLAESLRDAVRLRIPAAYLESIGA